MGLQIIFVVETTRKCNSDWIYIKDTIEHFYSYERTQVKFSVIYMEGKWKYNKKEKEINNLISQYRAASKSNQSKVIFCFDCDDYDINQEDADFLKGAKRYCDKKEYEFVWFCKDVEQVYLEDKVVDDQKKKTAAKFKENKLISNVSSKQLSANNFRANSSNIMLVLDRIGELKRSIT